MIHWRKTHQAKANCIFWTNLANCEIHHYLIPHADQGSNLVEMRMAGINKRFAWTIGISVDPKWHKKSADLAGQCAAAEGVLLQAYILSLETFCTLER